MDKILEMDIQAAKLELIRMIVDVKNQALLDQLKALLLNRRESTDKVHFFEEEANQYQKRLLEMARQPAPRSINLEEIKKSQNYNPKLLDDFLANLDRSKWENENLLELLEILRS
ncbi:MAG: hypothetical protein H6562_21910 [Lewinellaceae bacterium]|nr:hypothetical protein [Lewinellaceae bacterium]